MSKFLKYIVLVFQLLISFGGSGICASNEELKVQTLALPKIRNIFTIRPKNKEDFVASGHHYRSRENTRTAYDIIKELGATEFLRLASITHLDSVLKNPSSNFTVFVPTNEAMLVVPPNLSSNLSSIDMIIRFHVVNGLIQLSDFVQNGMLATYAKYGQATARHRMKIRTNIYKIKNSKLFSVNGAEIIKPNQDGNGTIVHLLNKALYPLPIQSAYYTVFDHPDFSILKSLLEMSITLLRVLSDLDRSLTFFAPTDEAFKKLPAGVLNNLKNDVPLLTQVLVDHITSHVFYSVGIPSHGAIKGVSGNKIEMKNLGNYYLINTNRATGHLSILDITVMNGVIHGIDTLLYRPKSHVDIIG